MCGLGTDLPLINITGLLLRHPFTSIPTPAAAVSNHKFTDLLVITCEDVGVWKYSCHLFLVSSTSKIDIFFL